MAPHEKDRKPVEEAIRRVLDGHENDYELIYEQCDRSLRAFVARHYYWAGPDFVEEVAVRTHEYALSRLSEYDAARSSYQTWLNWQSRSVASEVVRERFGRRLVQYDDGVHEAWAVSATGPADVCEDERLNRVLREEFDALPEDMRRCITLYDKDGLTLAESARASGLSVMQVRYKRRQGLAGLRRRLLERGVRPVAVDFTPAPIWYGQDHTDPDDFAAPTVARLPDGPDELVGAAACVQKEDDLE